MAIEPFTDELIDMNDVPALLPGGASLTTLQNWWKYGVRGVRLETVKIARKRYTTRAALVEFFRLRTANEAPSPEPQETERCPELTEQLRRAGLL